MASALDLPVFISGGGADGELKSAAVNLPAVDLATGMKAELQHDKWAYRGDSERTDAHATRTAPGQAGVAPEPQATGSVECPLGWHCCVLRDVVVTGSLTTWVSGAQPALDAGQRRCRDDAAGRTAASGGRRRRATFITPGVPARLPVIPKQLATMSIASPTKPGWPERKCRNGL
jgi:hypothetical protein